MRTPLSIATLGLGVFVLFHAEASAAPVTSADLAGKKFCWNGGGTENYYANRRYVSSVDGVGTWEIVTNGVLIKTNQITGLANMQKLPHGNFTSTWIVNGKPKTWTGRYCK